MGDHDRPRHRSSLEALTSDHLDPGYRAAAERSTPPSSPIVRGTALVVGALSIGCVVGASWATLGTDDADGPRHRAVLASVHQAQQRVDDLDDYRASLVTAVDAAREMALNANAGGPDLLSQLDSMTIEAGGEQAHGPGVIVTVGDPEAPADLSGSPEHARGSGAATVLDRDLQLLVNSLWVSGAEAVSVDGVRIGPTVTVRQAGGAMLVDNSPVFSPYVVAAIGSPNMLRARLAVSEANLRLSTLQQVYRIRFDVEPADRIEMPAAAIRPVRLAEPAGS